MILSNYPGTTVDFTKGTTRIGGEKFELVDVPGALATRIMETEKQRFIAATLMAIAVSLSVGTIMRLILIGI